MFPVPVQTPMPRSVRFNSPKIKTPVEWLFTALQNRRRPGEACEIYASLADAVKIHPVGIIPHSDPGDSKMKLILYDGPSDTLNTVVECRIGQLMMSGHAVQSPQLPLGSCVLRPATMDRMLFYKHLDYYVRRNGAWHLGRVAVWDGPPPEWHELPVAILFYVENDTVDHGLAMFRRVDDPLFPYPDHPLVPLFLSGKRSAD